MVFIMEYRAFVAWIMVHLLYGLWDIHYMDHGILIVWIMEHLWYGSWHVHCMEYRIIMVRSKTYPC